MSEIKTNSMLPAFRARALSRVMEYMCTLTSMFFRAIQIVRQLLFMRAQEIQEHALPHMSISI